ncbi:MAG TPA: hypothetical protein VN226_02310 [Anaerolineales bacterium]|nr:hypothetical protein [Anaerolineales bacterium]
MAIDYSATNSLDYTDSNAASKPASDSNADTAMELEQLNSLRQSIQTTTLTHFQHQLSKILPTSQVSRIVNHPNVKFELDRLIQRVSLKPHSDINSLSYQIARGLTQVTEPHLRLAVSLSTTGQANVPPEDIIQDTIKNNASVQGRYNPISNSLKPAAADSSVSKLYQRLQSTMVNGPNNLPTLKPNIDKIVALGSTGFDANKQQQIAADLHQNLLSEILTHQSPSPINTNQLVKTYLQKHGLDTNKISAESLNEFVESVDSYQEIVVADPQISTLQHLLEENHLSADQLQDFLHQTGQTPEQIILDLQTSSPPPDTIPASAPSPTAYSTPPTPIQIEQAIANADQYDYFYDYTSTSPVSQSYSVIHRFIQLIQDSRQQYQSIKQFNNIINHGFPNISGNGLGSNFNNFLKGFTQGKGGGLSSAFNSLKSLFGGGGTAAAAGGTAATAGGTATAAAVATSEIWVPILIIVLIILLIVLVIIWPSANTAIKSNIATTSGAGGGNSGAKLVSNPFIELTKTGTPPKLDDPIGQISYTYSITAKQGALTNIVVTDEVISVFSQTGVTETKIAAPPPPNTVDTTWTSGNYSFPLDSSMDDSIVTNVITLSATAPDGSSQTIQASFSTIIGAPPTGCFIFNSGPISGVTTVKWENYASEQQKEMAAISTILSRLGPANVCGAPINLFLASEGVSVNYGGWYLGGGNIALDFKFDSLSTLNNALYTLAHETGHELSSRLPNVYADFIASNLVSWNGKCQGNIYPFEVYLTSEAACFNENFAEGIACFVNPSAPNCQANFTSSWQSFFQSHFP